MTLKLYFMKCLERKISQCILPFKEFREIGKDVSLRLILKDFNLMVEIFLKRGNIRKRVRWNRGLKHLFTLCIAVSREFHAKLVCFFFFFVIKRILKALFSFIPLLLNSSDSLSYGSNLRKRYTLRLLSICLGRSTHPLLHTPSIPSSIFLP